MLFESYALNAVALKNRIVMPPMTRSRAGAGDVATDMMAEYYAQRASAGLIISEGTQISQQGQGYAWTPGMYTESQIAGWKKSLMPYIRQAAKFSRSCGTLAVCRIPRFSRVTAHRFLLPLFRRKA